MGSVKPAWDFRCSKCGIIKTAADFSCKHVCRICVKQRNKEYRVKNAAAIRDWHKAHRQAAAKAIAAQKKVYRAANAERISEKQKQNYRRTLQSIKERRKRNAESIKNRMYEWRRKNAEAIYERIVQWKAANPDKIKEQRIRRRARKEECDGSHTAAEWRALVERFKGHCVCCGKYFGIKKLSEDHVVPLSLGGSDFIENIQPLCKPCNSGKRNLHCIDYRKQF